MALTEWELSLTDYPDWSTVTVERQKIGKIDYELNQSSKFPVIQNLRVIIQPRSAFTNTTLIGRYTEMTHTLYCRVVDMQGSDEVVEGDKRYKVLGVDNYVSNHLEVAIKEMPK